MQALQLIVPTDSPDKTPQPAVQAAQRPMEGAR